MPASSPKSTSNPNPQVSYTNSTPCPYPTPHFEHPPSFPNSTHHPISRPHCNHTYHPISPSIPLPIIPPLIPFPTTPHPNPYLTPLLISIPSHTVATPLSLTLRSSPNSTRQPNTMLNCNHTLHFIPPSYPNSTPCLNLKTHPILMPSS